MTLVSICIPTYNGEPWIEAAIASAQAQTRGPIEIVVGDDRSSDRTVQLVEGLAADDPRIRLGINTTRVGMARNWNATAGRARGEFVKFLFQDDLLDPECLAAMVAEADRHPDAALIVARRRVLVEGGSNAAVERWLATNREVPRPPGAPDRMRGHDFVRWALDDGLRRNLVGEPTAVLLRRDAMGSGFNPRLRQAVDYEMWIRIAARGDIAFVDRTLCTFRVHAASATFAQDDRATYAIERLWLLASARKVLGRRTVAWIRLLPRALARATMATAGTGIRHPTQLPRRGRDLLRALAALMG